MKVRPEDQDSVYVATSKEVLKKGRTSTGKSSARALEEAKKIVAKKDRK